MTPIDDLTGRRFGYLIVIRRAENLGGKPAWECQCDCGNSKVIRSSSLKRGYTTSCGCYNVNKQVRDLTGEKFGSLTVIKRCGKLGKLTAWKCLCDCGNSIIVRGSDIVKGHTRSCGCLMRRTSKERMTTHGKSNTRVYNIYTRMLDRCYNPANEHYDLYGGRKISVCDEWRSDFNLFFKFAIENGYSEQMTIDRINVDGNYEPDNCRFVSFKIQQNNRRNNLRVTINNKTQTLSQWADEVCINPKTLYTRYYNGDRELHLIRPLKRK